MRAGFAETDITPPLGTEKIGWIRSLVADTILDPLFAKVAVFESRGERLAFVYLDTLSLGWNQVDEIRRRVGARWGFRGDAVMVSATHNHAGPAVTNCGEVRRDEAYTEFMIGRVVDAFGAALASLTEAEVGVGRAFEWDLSCNRRVVMRDGTVRTHGSFADPESLCIEGPIDPEVAVIAARRPDGEWLGCIVNYACHPTHHGGSGEISAGYPGRLAACCRERGCPVALFLNGCCGNVSYQDVTGRRPPPSKEAMGAALATDVFRAIEAMAFDADLPLRRGLTTLRLPFRPITDDEIRGTVRGAQRFIDPKLYDGHMPELVARIRRRGTQLAEVQILALGDAAVVGIPAEYFVEHGLRIKEETYPRRTLVASCTNGMVGYVPTRDAFRRGGYETTFGFGYTLAPEAGDLLADAAIGLVANTITAPA